MLPSFVDVGQELVVLLSDSSTTVISLTVLKPFGSHSRCCQLRATGGSSTPRWNFFVSFAVCPLLQTSAALKNTPEPCNYLYHPEQASTSLHSPQQPPTSLLIPHPSTTLTPLEPSITQHSLQQCLKTLQSPQHLSTTHNPSATCCLVC